MTSGRKTRNSGFTLIEVIIAVLILAGSLSLLLGMQTKIVTQTIRDRNEEHAMLIGRRIMSAVEIEDQLEPMQKQGNARELLELLLGENAVTQDERSFLESFDALLEINLIDLTITPDLKIPEAIKRVRLEVAWGMGLEDRLSILYFLPNNEQIE